MSIFLLIILISFIEYVGDSNLKSFARTDQIQYLLYGIISYSVMIYFLIMALRSENVIWVNSIWDGTSALIETVLAMILLHETLSNGIQYAGIGMIIIGILFLNYKAL